ncbi:MAG: hcalcium-binding protein, partial [Pseudomonadota bacterium]
MMLQFESVVATGTAALDSGIGDLALKTFNGETYLYSTTGPEGGIVSWHLTDAGAPVLQDQQYFDASIAQQVGREATLVTLGGTPQLVLDVDSAMGLVGYDLNTDGTIGTLQETPGLSGGGDISAAAQSTIGAHSFMTLAHEDSGQIGTYSVNGDGSLSLTG